MTELAKNLADLKTKLCCCKKENAKLKQQVTDLTPAPTTPVELLTVTVDNLTPVPTDVYRVSFIGEQGQGYFTFPDILDDGVAQSMDLPNTGTYTIIVEVISGASSGNTLLNMTNASLPGLPADRPMVTGRIYAKTGRTLAATYNMTIATV